MPHIALPEGVHGMHSLVEYRKDTGQALLQLAHATLHGDSPLSAGERELIATHVAQLNGCTYCAGTHGGSAAALLDCDMESLPTAAGGGTTVLTDKLRSFLAIAAETARGGRAVQEETIASARAEGATDREIHDVVMVAALMCMATRYVDGLATRLPEDAGMLEQKGRWLARNGYLPKT